MDKRQTVTEQLTAACRQAAAHGLLALSSGNMSCRIDDETAAVTASGAWLAEITPAEIAICRIADGAALNDKQPTVESGFHLGILRKRPEVNVVLHFQSPYATAIACGRDTGYNFNVIPEVPIYIGEVGWVRYIAPGSKLLADAVVDSALRHDMVILQNHGQVAVGTDFKDVIQKAGFFELACRILLTQDNPAFITEQKKGYEGNT